MPASPRWAAPVVAAAVLFAVVATSAVAGAHAILIGSNPGPGDTVPELDQVRLEFADDLSPQGDHLVVIRTAQGDEVEASDYELVDGVTLIARFDAELPDGDHEIGWDTVAADGHRESGLIPFSVAADPAGAPAPEDEPADEPLEVQAPPLELVSSAPQDGSRITELAEIRFDFDAELAPDGDHRVAVRLPGGEERPADELELIEPTALLARFDVDLEDGDQQVVWSAEGLDGGRADGVLDLTVEAAEARDEPAAPWAWIALGVAVAAVVAGAVWLVLRRQDSVPSAS